jgi:tRNA (cytidine/uridine-2'-O-)-methyltransferase
MLAKRDRRVRSMTAPAHGLVLWKVFISPKSKVQSLKSKSMHWLVEPEIAPNTGNVARLCAATRTTLHLIEPFGFKLDDAQLKRAGMDYWQHVEWHRWPNWVAFAKRLPTSAQLWFIESGGPKPYTEASYVPDDYLVFGAKQQVYRKLLEKI